MPLDFHSATDPNSARPPAGFDWCQATDPDRHVPWRYGYMRWADQGTPDGGDLLGWVTLGTTAPVLLVGALLALALIAA